MSVLQVSTKSPVSSEQYPGLAYATVLANVGGNCELLVKLAELFLEQHAADTTLIEAALAKGDEDLARQLAHALRGTAGNLGAMKLHDATRSLEMSLISGDMTATKVPAEMKTAMAELIPSLQRLIVDLSAD